MKFTPTSKRMIIAAIGLVAVGCIAGWAFGGIDTKDALIVVTPIITGFFTLLRGEDEAGG